MLNAYNTWEVALDIKLRSKLALNFLIKFVKCYDFGKIISKICEIVKK
jgi:hypothetical protein